MNYKKIGLFCGLSYLMCWLVAFGYFMNGGSVESLWFIPVAIGCMFTPGIAAIIVQKFIYRNKLTEIGLTFKLNKWFVVAWLFPVGLIAVITFVSSFFPGSEFSSGFEFIQEQIKDKVPPREIEQAMQTLYDLGPNLPFVLVVGSVVSALIAGPTINAIPALGEELGWRGFLQNELSPLGFWPSSIIVGLIWGFWHLPLILYGYNYPGYPVAGIFMMTLLTVMLSPVFAQIRLSADSVYAAAVVHGVFNALAGLPLLFISGGSPIITGVTGVAGILVLLFVNLGLFIYRHKTMKADTIDVGI